MPKPMAASLIRRGYESEVRGERDNYRRAVDEVATALAALQRRIAEDAPIDATVLGDLRRLVAGATEAYQRAAAWAALERVEFILPGTDETTED